LSVTYGVIALIFRCKITRGELGTTDETVSYCWANRDEITDLASEASAVA